MNSNLLFISVTMVSIFLHWYQCCSADIQLRVYKDDLSHKESEVFYFDGNHSTHAVYFRQRVSLWVSWHLSEQYLAPQLGHDC